MYMYLGQVWHSGSGSLLSILALISASEMMYCFSLLYVCMYVCMYVCLCFDIRLRNDVMLLAVYVCVYIYIYMHIHMYGFAYLLCVYCIHIYTHIHIHIYAKDQREFIEHCCMQTWMCAHAVLYVCICSSYLLFVSRGKPAIIMKTCIYIYIYIYIKLTRISGIA